jgi:hypothetical protein
MMDKAALHEGRSTMRKLLLLVALASALAATLVPAAGANRVLPASATPMEMSLDVWVATYMRAGLKRSPAAETALFTVNGGKCGFAFGKVWFLPDVFRPAQLETTCAIPRGKLVLVPGANLVAPASRRNIDVRHDAVRATIESSEIWIDGASIGTGHWVSAPVFPAVLPIRNAVFAPPGLWNNLVDGYYVIVALSPGRHTIVTESVYNDPREVYGYTYNLTVG